MTTREMQNSFELTVSRYDSTFIVESHLVFYWLNEAIESLVKLKYLGDTVDGDSFEQSQRRTDDLRLLQMTAKLTATVSGNDLNKVNSYTATLPVDYLFRIGEEVDITLANISGDDVTIRQEVTEVTNDNVNAKYRDPFGEHKVHYDEAKPLRLFYQDHVELISDGNYTVDFYYLKYLKQPSIISLDTDVSEFPEYMHSEIVDKAVELFRTSENTSGIQ